jgi:hypothetical protein
MTHEESNGLTGEQYEALCAFELWTKSHKAAWRLGYVRENGKFARYMDPDTDTAWMGFEAAWKAARPALSELASTPTSLEMGEEVEEDTNFRDAYDDLVLKVRCLVSKP